VPNFLKVSANKTLGDYDSWDLNFLFDDGSMQGCLMSVGASADMVVKRLRGLASIIEQQHGENSPKQGDQK